MLAHFFSVIIKCGFCKRRLHLIDIFAETKLGYKEKYLMLIDTGQKFQTVQSEK